MTLSVAEQPGPPVQNLTYGSDATFRCIAQQSYIEFREIAWTVAVGDSVPTEIDSLPTVYGKARHHFIIVQ